jgi:hypothetical protein
MLIIRYSVALCALLTLTVSCKKNTEDPTPSSSNDKPSKDIVNQAPSGADATGSQAPAQVSSTSGDSALSDKQLDALLKSLHGGTNAAAAGESSKTQQEGDDDTPPFIPYQAGDSSETRLDSYRSQTLNKGKEPVEFSCPGNSVISGLASSYDDASKDRIHTALCLFYMDMQRQSVRKLDCTSHQETGELQGTREFSCPAGKILAGFSSTYEAAKFDRKVTYQCCTMESADHKPVVYNEEKCTNRVPMGLREQLSAYWMKRYNLPNFGGLSVNDEVNDWKMQLGFTCQFAVSYDAASGIQHLYGASMRKISSIYSTTHQDRRYSFQCCQLTVADAQNKKGG